MKFSIALDCKPRLVSLRDSIATALQKYRAAESALAKMTDDLPIFTDAVAKLESESDYRDEKSVAAILTKRAQLDLLTRKITISEDALNSLPGTLLTLMREVKPVISGATRPFRESLVEEITGALKPHTGAGPALAFALSKSPKLLSFDNFFGQPWDIDERFALANAPRAVAFLSDLLDGKNTWTFKAE